MTQRLVEHVLEWFATERGAVSYAPGGIHVHTRLTAIVCAAVSLAAEKKPASAASRIVSRFPNNRLPAIEDGHVRFQWKDYRDNDRQKTMALSAQEFIRFLETGRKRSGSV
jgi:hypothetical protein